MRTDGSRAVIASVDAMNSSRSGSSALLWYGTATSRNRQNT